MGNTKFENLVFHISTVTNELMTSSLGESRSLMKMKYLLHGWYYLATLSTLILAMNTQAQRENRPSSAQNRLRGNFNQSAPAIGSVIPLLEGFDADGAPWNTGLLRNQHSVLIFGCLT